MKTWIKMWWKYILTTVGIVAVLCGYAVLQSRIYVQNGREKIQTGGYNSPYTYVEQNKDGTYSLYVYAGAVQWKDGDTYRKIDNSIVQSPKDGFCYENAANEIKTYFPKTSDGTFLLQAGEEETAFTLTDIQVEGRLEEYVNLYGDKRKAICYALGSNINLYIYAISGGFHVEYIFSDGFDATHLDALRLSFADGYSEHQKSEYIFFKKGEKQTSIVYAPMIKAEDSERLIYDTAWAMTKEDEMFCLQPEKMTESEIGHGKVHFAYTVQLHREDIPDTTMYEKKDENVYLSDRAIVGKNNIIGEGWHYTRYRLNYFFQLDESKVISAKYYIKNMDGQKEKPQICFYNPLNQWSSTLMFWKTKTGYYPQKQNTSCAYTEENWIIADLTPFIKEIIADETWMMESLGSVIVCDEDYAVLATSDNGEYIPYMKIVMSELPETMIQNEVMNKDVNEMRK